MLYLMKRMRERSWVGWLPALCGAAMLVALGGCANQSRTAAADEVLSADRDDMMVIPAGRYADAFSIAQDEIRSLGFLLDRVDARQGVISTQPKPAIGLAGPWDQSQSSAAQEFDDMLHRHKRVIRVTFMPAMETVEPGEQADPLAVSQRDLVTDGASQPVRAQVRAWVVRVQKPGWRPDSTDLLRSGYWWDPALGARGMQPQYDVPGEEDRLLAERVARRIADRVARAE
jgi:hypothetical protein